MVTFLKKSIAARQCGVLKCPAFGGKGFPVDVVISHAVSN